MGSSVVQKNLLIKFLLISFYSVFGIIVIIDDLANETEIVDSLLDDIDNNANFHIPDSDMHDFLKYVAKQEVMMDQEAEKMLNDYYTATRMIRQGLTYILLLSKHLMTIYF